MTARDSADDPSDSETTDSTDRAVTDTSDRSTGGESSPSPPEGARDDVAPSSSDQAGYADDAGDPALGMVQRTAGLTTVFAFFILFNPVIFTGHGSIIWINFLVGSTIGTFAAYNVYRAGGGQRPLLSGSVVVAALGLWTLASPFVLDVGTELVFWSNVILGLLVTVFAALTIYGGRKASAR